MQGQYFQTLLVLALSLVVAITALPATTTTSNDDPNPDPDPNSITIATDAGTTQNITITNTLSPPAFYHDCTAAIALFPYDPPPAGLPQHFSREKPFESPYHLPKYRVSGSCYTNVVLKRGVVWDASSWYEIRSKLVGLNQRCLDDEVTRAEVYAGTEGNIKVSIFQHFVAS